MGELNLLSEYSGGWYRVKFLWSTIETADEHKRVVVDL